MKRSILAAAVGCALALAACGGSSHRTSATATTSHAVPAPAIASACPVGNSFMGCAVQAQVGIVPRSVAAPAGAKFVDVSDWQPSVNWRAVKAAGIIGVVVKAGEGLAEDPTFNSHIAGARATGLRVQAYWFERPVGCSAEAAAINRVVPKGMKVVFDLEVPGVGGYAACERVSVQAHTGIAPVDYTAPGVWPGGSSGGLALWQAEYGPVLNVFFRPLVAWQYTDAASVAGIPGLSDESVNYGLFPASNPLPVCFSHRMTTAKCAAAKARIASDERAAAASARALHAVDGVLAANRCRKPYRRGVCRRNGAAAATFAQRIRYFTAAAARIRAAS